MSELEKGFKFGIGFILAQIMISLILFIIVCLLVGAKIIDIKNNSNNEYAYVELDY